MHTYIRNIMQYAIQLQLGSAHMTFREMAQLSYKKRINYVYLCINFVIKLTSKKTAWLLWSKL